MTAPIRRPLWLVAAALSIGAGVIHFALGPEHLIELGPLGYGFYVSGALQVAWAAALLCALWLPAEQDRDGALRLVAWTGIAINLAILAAWAFSRVVGLPAGETPWTPEAIGRPDTVAGLLEAALVLGLAVALRGWRIGESRSTRWLAIGVAISLSVVMVGTVYAIAPDPSGHADGHEAAEEHAAGDHAMDHDHAAGTLITIPQAQAGSGRR